MKRITLERHLTPEEASHYDAVRDQIERERPEIEAQIRKHIAERRRAEARQAGRDTLGERLRAAREARGLPQVELASAAQISQGYLSQLERDEREPSLSIAARLAKALGISLDELAAGAV